MSSFPQRRILWYPWQFQNARSGLRAYRAGLALLAEPTQPQGPHTLAEVCRLPPEGPCAPQTQDRAQHLAVPGTAKWCAKRGQACLVSHWRKPVATEEPDEGNLHVRICGEGAG